MTNTTVPDVIERTTDLPHPVDAVWDALTDPAQFARWFADEASWELRPGAPMTMRWEKFGTAPGEIVAVEPKTRFAYRWGSEDRPLTPSESTLVEWTLTPTAGGGTTLRVVESGFAVLHNGPSQFVDNTQGWAEQFDNIARFLGAEA